MDSARCIYLRVLTSSYECDVNSMVDYRGGKIDHPAILCWSHPFTRLDNCCVIAITTNTGEEQRSSVCCEYGKSHAR